MWMLHMQFLRVEVILLDTLYYTSGHVLLVTLYYTNGHVFNFEQLEHVH